MILKHSNCLGSCGRVGGKSPDLDRGEDAAPTASFCDFCAFELA